MNDVDAVKNILVVSQAHLIEIGLILVGSWLLIALEQRLLPWLAVRSPDRYRHVLLATVPVLRLLIIAAAFALIIPRIVDADL